MDVSDSTIKKLSTLSSVPTTLEVLKLRSFFSELREQIKLSSYPNIVKLHLNGRMPLNSEAFPPNLVKLTLCNFEVDGHVVAMLKKLPKLRILKMYRCDHTEASYGLREVTCRDDVSMPKLKKLLLRIDSNVRLSERLAKLRV